MILQMLGSMTVLFMAAWIIANPEKLGLGITAAHGYLGYSLLGVVVVQILIGFGNRQVRVALLSFW